MKSVKANIDKIKNKMSELKFASEIIECFRTSPMMKAAKKEIRELKRENAILRRLLTQIKNQSPEDYIEFVREVKVNPNEVSIKIEPGAAENISYEIVEESAQPFDAVSSIQSEEEAEEAEEAEEEEAEEEEAEEEEAEEEEAKEEEAEEEEAEALSSPNLQISEQEQEQDETEVYEVTIRGKKYFTTDSKNGSIYQMDSNGDVGEEIGNFKNGIAKLNH